MRAGLQRTWLTAKDEGQALETVRRRITPEPAAALHENVGEKKP
ncbi:hypothetical protein AB0G54_17790 [Streptomyces yokosukanensis]